jgi:xylulose-5-phosphate/fructose-6-phosphate phosphoketolase
MGSAWVRAVADREEPGPGGAGSVAAARAVRGREAGRPACPEDARGGFEAHRRHGHTPNTRSAEKGGTIGAEPASGAALDNSDLIVACIVGDGEAERGPTAGLTLELVPIDWPVVIA